MMQSRICLLLKREYQDLKENQLFGISAAPISDNLVEWIAKVQGLKDSIWEGAVLQLAMRYTEKYNYEPPSIKFNTIPFHPNVDPVSGKLCLPFLDIPEQWNPCITMSNMLLTIQAMLSNPVSENAVNLEAAQMLKINPSMYRAVVSNCVRVCRLIECGSLQSSATVRKIQDVNTPTEKRKIKPVSFEDYHRNWTEIATSKPAEDLNHLSYNEATFNTGTSSQWNYNKHLIIQNSETTPKHILLEMDTQLHTLCSLSGARHLTTATHMKEKEQLSKGESYVKTLSSHHGVVSDREPWETEVDKLVAWTDSLCIDLLED
ncbi:ubiquitin-conjugating enzyme E2 U [Xenopus tropicalis]|uniref:Ubiquitin-conjugating enzyme E2 U n=1 Tax=Xenopus tropicalis TaxID=8364 RepID=A0A6I8QZT0_XENTR|nr:ubiquitin-conjugating enzyme E2 U [Xenopus tropicalis]|eukprot:XP_004913986.1 PREDICTED: ubiquitin-conjugating enzyme E2 U [Xenopus tropicalis]